MSADIGIDEKGYILNCIHRDNISEPWLSLVNESIREIKEKFKENLNSIYIYGSVGRGDPKLNSSDLDFTVVLNSKITDEITKDFQLINETLTGRYSFTREVGFDLGFIEDVLDKRNIYSWGFWLKTCCYCLEGEDLSLKFSKFKPSNKIAKAINGDLEEWIKLYTSKIKDSKDENINELYCQQIMKKIIRTGFSFVMEKENSWTGDLRTSYKLFLKHYPTKKNVITKAFKLIEAPISDRETLTAILNKFNWMMLEINKKNS